MTETPGLRVRSLVRHYPDTEHPTLDQVELDVDAGHVVAVMAPSGVGKSTLLRIVGGVDLPDSGHVELRARDGTTIVVSALDASSRDALRRSRIGFVYQEPHLLAHLTARENVAAAGLLTGDPRDVRDRRARGLLDQLGLRDRENARPDELSGGQQQRVAIGRALYSRPELVLCDEPTGALDQETSRSVMSVLRDVARRDRAAIVIATHDPVVCEHADEVVHLDGGLAGNTAPVGVARAPIVEPTSVATPGADRAEGSAIPWAVARRDLAWLVRRSVATRWRQTAIVAAIAAVSVGLVASLVGLTDATAARVERDVRALAPPFVEASAFVPGGGQAGYGWGAIEQLRPAPLALAGRAGVTGRLGAVDDVAVTDPIFGVPVVEVRGAVGEALRDVDHVGRLPRPDEPAAILGADAGATSLLLARPVISVQGRDVALVGILAERTGIPSIDGSLLLTAPATEHLPPRVGDLADRLVFRLPRRLDLGTLEGLAASWLSSQRAQQSVLGSESARIVADRVGGEFEVLSLLLGGVGLGVAAIVAAVVTVLLARSRRRELAILRGLGVPHLGLRLSLALEVAAVATIGVAIGSVLAGGIALAGSDRLGWTVSPDVLLGSSAVVVAVVAIVSTLAASRALRGTLVAALRRL